MMELRHWLALVRTPGVGPVLLTALLEHYGTPQALVPLKKSPLPDQINLPARALAWLKHPDWNVVDADLRWMQDNDCQLVTRGSPNYPPLLKHLADAPVALFVRGDPALLQSHQLAIVGSRNPTAQGRELARDFAGTLAAAGLTITSGMAMGIDAHAHAAALEAGCKTLAVCGTGLDITYPRGNAELAARLVRDGALVSEFPLGTPPRAANFPRRNRIISGLSLGTLVVEAAYRSGSLITARLAAEQGREVFAIPGSIHNALARGCHRLIRDGAKLVETANDVVEELGELLKVADDISPASKSRNSMEVTDPDYQQLLDKVGYDPTPVDVIVERTGMATGSVSAMLLNLELRGSITASPGGRYSRVT